jgi:hypothetical protein
MRSKELCDVTYRSRCVLPVVKPVRVVERGEARHVPERTEMRTGFWWGNLKEGDYLEGRIILKWILQKWDGMAWCGSLGLG